jgi:hypothetical protein
VVANCPIGASVRRVWVWFLLFALLLRKPNRSLPAWAVALVLGVVSVILHIAQDYINAHIIFYLDRHICTVICEMLQALAVSLAVLLAVSDLIPFRNRLLRFLLILLILLAAGAVAILPNAPIVAGPVALVALFGFFLLTFLIGHVLLRTLLGWLAGPRRLAWSAVAALLLGIAPVLAFAIVGSILNRSMQLQSTTIAFRSATTISEAFLGPYFVLFWFLLLALLVPLYRQRLAQSFGYVMEQTA